MSQTLLFARHGNTFGPGDKVVWVGRETDLPLVEKGLEQAAAAAEALRRTDLIPDAIYCASLQRTRRFAAIVAEASSVAPVGSKRSTVPPLWLMAAIVAMKSLGDVRAPSV